MKKTISQAMRKGMKQGKQLYGTLSRDNGDSCAMGAVGLGLGKEAGSLCRTDFYKELREQYPYLTQKTECPECESEVDYTDSDVIDVVVHLNNEHRMTRSKIATWIESTYEPRPPKKTKPVEKKQTLDQYMGTPFLDAYIEAQKRRELQLKK